MIGAMKFVTAMLALVAVFAALFGAGPQQAWACFCIPPGYGDSDIQRQVEYSEAVIVGTGERLTPGDPNVIEVRVQRVYKGDMQAHYRVRENSGVGDCSAYSPDVGLTHVLFLRRRAESRSPDGVLWADADPPGVHSTRACEFVSAPADSDTGRRVIATLERLYPASSPSDASAEGSETDGDNAAFNGRRAPIGLVGAYIAGSLVALGALFVRSQAVRRGQLAERDAAASRERWRRPPDDG